jgi:hypothetical protein
MNLLCASRVYRLGKNITQSFLVTRETRIARKRNGKHNITLECFERHSHSIFWLIGERHVTVAASSSLAPQQWQQRGSVLGFGIRDSRLGLEGHPCPLDLEGH